MNNQKVTIADLQAKVQNIEGDRDNALLDTLMMGILIGKQAQIAQTDIDERIITQDYSKSIKDITQQIEDAMGSPDNLPQVQKIDSSEERLLTQKFLEQIKREEAQELKKRELEKQYQQERTEELLQQFKQEEEKQKSEKEQNDYKDANCPICFGPLDLDYWPLNCGHLFHKDCLFDSYKSDIEKQNFPIKCSFDGCTEEVIIEDLSQVIKSKQPELLEKYWNFTLDNFIDRNLQELSWCPTPNCQFAFVLDMDSPEFVCLLCNQQYCMRCQTEFHVGQTCQEYQISQNPDANDQAFMDLIQGSQFKSCPKCQIWVQKLVGCNYMTCRCGTNFCYNCGGFYGKCQCGQIVPGHPVYDQPIVIKPLPNLNPKPKKPVLPAQNFKQQR